MIEQTVSAASALIQGAFAGIVPETKQTDRGNMTIYAIYDANGRFLGYHAAGSEQEAVTEARRMVPGKPYSALVCW